MEKLLTLNDRKYDLVVIGRVTIDLNPLDGNKTLDKSSNFAKYLGGSAGNIAVGAARLGLKVAMLSCVSNDQHGTFLKNYLQKVNVDTSFMQIAQHGEKTGLTFTEMKSETESSILMYRENVADLALEVKNEHETLIKNSKVIVISGTALARSPSRETVLNAIALAKKHQTKIVFDIDYRPYTWKSTVETSIYYNNVAKAADIIIGSREEFNLVEKQLIAKHSDEKTASYYLKTASLIVIKHGKHGSRVFTKNGAKYNVAIFPIKLLKSFGGGDAYVAALLYGLLTNQSWEFTLTLAAAHAAFVVSAHSCSDALMTKEELTDFVKKHQKALPIVKKIS